MKQIELESLAKDIQSNSIEFAVGNESGNVQFYDLDLNFKETVKAHFSAVTSVCLSDTVFATGGTDSLFNVFEDKMCRRAVRKGDSGVTEVACSSDSNFYSIVYDGNIEILEESTSNAQILVNKNKGSLVRWHPKSNFLVYSKEGKAIGEDEGIICLVSQQ